MSDTQHTNPRVVPSDPAMAASDPGMFAALTYDEGVILYGHLNSGWTRQSAVYEPVSELWKDTRATLVDLLDARTAARQAERELEAGQ